MATPSREDRHEEVHPAAEGPSAVVAAFIGAWERNNPDEIGQLFSDDAVWFDAYPANQFTGTEQIRAQLERYSRHLSDISIEVLHQAVVGNVVFQERVDRGMRDGVPFEVAAVCVFTVRNGKIVENRDYWNPGAYIRRPGREDGAA
jgi:limonene-1,2-epoxide hydrolase